MKTAAQWIAELQLERHPEGGWYRRTFESCIQISRRPAMTSIYYLLESSEFSALHRLEMDEQWHFYTGSPITIHEIGRDGSYTESIIGRGSFQHVIPAGNLFGATVERGFALVGCTVVPGFDFAGFEMPPREQLLAEYPGHETLIHRLTR